jgi:hypothetical protein
LRSRNLVTGLARGENWDDLVKAAGLTDTAKCPGLLVLNGPSPVLGGASHFHCYLPLFCVKDAVSHGRLGPTVEETVFQISLESVGGILGLVSAANRMWAYPRHRHLLLFHAVCRFWQTLNAEGERYTVGSARGQRLWSVDSNLKYVMANLGVPTAILNAPLPEEGPASLVPASNH